MGRFATTSRKRPLRLRSKRFRVVSEQRQTEERRGLGFSVLAGCCFHPIFRAVFGSSSLPRNGTETLATQASDHLPSAIAESSHFGWSLTGGLTVT